MNKIIAVMAIVFAFTLGTIFSADIATAVKPVTEVLITNTEPIPVTGSISSNPACPEENVQHWKTISWGALDLDHPTLPSIGDGFVKVQVDPNGVIQLRELVAEKLNELGYTLNGNPITFSDLSANHQSSQIICAEN